MVDAINEDTTADTWSDAKWQSALVMLGYDIGSFGPNKDGIDGEWGNSSKAGLVRFQSDNSLPTSGLRDNVTKLKLKTLLEIVSGGDK